MRRNVYFLSDAHLGSRAMADNHAHERKLVRFLESIRHDAAAIYLLGDMFDFWYEYKMVVPKGYTRFLGKLSELTDSGVEVHFMVGNHDLWCQDYLTEECGVIMHHEPFTCQMGGREFYMAHGDGLGDRDWKFQILRAIFHNTTLQRLFAMLHPRWSIAFGLAWAKHSRLKHLRGDELRYQGEDEECLVRYAKQYLQTHSTVNYFMFGHRHIELDLMLSRTSRIMILGDWITQCTYAYFDGKNMMMCNYVEES